MIPPGLRQLAVVFSHATIPLLLAQGSVTLAQTYWSWHVPLILHALALLLSVPISILYRVLAFEFWKHRRASKLGAVVPPQVQASRSAILKSLIQDFRTGYLGESLRQWSEVYGPTFAFTIFTLEPAHIKAVLATQFEDFGKGGLTGYSDFYGANFVGDQTLDQFKSLLGSGIFSTDGDTWKFHRTMARPFFTKERISDFETFAKHSDETLHQLSQRLAEGHPVEIQDLVARFTLDSATEYLFGKSVDSLAAGLPYHKSSDMITPSSFAEHPSTSFVHSFSQGQEVLANRGRIGSYWRFAEFWRDEALPYRKIINDYVDPIVKEALKAPGGQAKREAETFLSHLLESTTDSTLIQDQLISILVAGRDTTAGTLTFAIYMMTQRPDIVRRLRDEIMDHVGDTRYPTYQDIRDMKYLRAFVNEILRLYPIVPMNARISNRETTLPSTSPGGLPIHVPHKTVVLYSVFLLHRRTDLWGPDALEFDPDRFIDERLNKYLTKNPFIFVPFNAGPRICVGQQFAYNEVSFFLIRLLQSFDKFELDLEAQSAESRPPLEWIGCAGPKGRDKIRLNVALTMMARGGVWVKMGRAGDQNKLQS